MNLPDTFYRLINGDYPDWDSLEFLNSQTAISNRHFLKFFKLRGWISGLSKLTLGDQDLENVELPDRFEYKATFKDELGSLELSSPVYSDERQVHAQLVEAYNSESVIEMMVFVSPAPKIDAKGRVRNHSEKVITFWPVQLRVLYKFEEEGSFIWTGKHWQVNFRGETINYPEENGFYYIHELLMKPDEYISSLNMAVGRRQVTVPNIELAVWKDFMFNEKAKDSEIDGYLRKLKPRNRTIVKNLNAEILKSLKEIGNLDPHANKEEKETLEANLIQLKEEIFEVLEFRDDKGDTATSIIKHTANYVSKAIRRALEKINKEQPTLHVILANRLVTGAHCLYVNRVDHPITWLT